MTADATPMAATELARSSGGALSFDALDRVLRDSATDLALDNDERFELREIGRRIDADRVRFLRNRAFAIARDVMAANAAHALDALRWLEQVLKTLEAVAAPPPAASRACFAPGEDCLRALRELCRAARSTLDVCVFTISDDRLSAELIACHRRGVVVRVVSDDDKQHDDGSDIAKLRDAGLPVRLDRTPHHMHHKFVLVDGRLLANGSFNWTRSATTANEENLVVTADPVLVQRFGERFEALWAKFAQDGAAADGATAPDRAF
jgi:cardiolipin hydrolase